MITDTKPENTKGIPIETIYNSVPLGVDCPQKLNKDNKIEKNIKDNPAS